MMWFGTVYYCTNDPSLIRRIQDRFRFPRGFTINGEWRVIVMPEDWELALWSVEHGYIQLRTKPINRIMKASEVFKKRIADYLSEEAEKDELFAVKMKAHPEKDAEAVCNFIMKQVYETTGSKGGGFDDSEIFGWAKHFIDEDTLKPDDFNNTRCEVVIDRHVDLSEAEKEEAKKQAQQTFLKEMREKELEKEKQAEERKKKQAEAKKKKAIEKQKELDSRQPSLFDFGLE